jgi:hypothetical protein
VKLNPTIKMDRAEYEGAEHYQHKLSFAISRERIYSVVLHLDTGDRHYKEERLSKTFISRNDSMQCFDDLRYIRSLSPQIAIELFKNYSSY